MAAYHRVTQTHGISDRSGGGKSIPWFDSGLGGTEFLAARYRDFAFVPHLHETYAIGVIEKGGQLFQPERKARLIMPESTLFVINPRVVHEGRSATDCD